MQRSLATLSATFQRSLHPANTTPIVHLSNVACMSSWGLTHSPSVLISIAVITAPRFMPSQKTCHDGSVANHAVTLAPQLASRHQAWVPRAYDVQLVASALQILPGL